jgi:ribulose-phosphate 3-epimerase
MIKLSPSLLAANFASLGADAVAATNAGAEYLHFDIMDGRFVPNISFGADVVRAIRPLVSVEFDVHMMTLEPDVLIPSFVGAGASMITIHPEPCVHLHRVISQIRDLGVKPGIALNPSTPLSALEWIIEDIDRILVMTVNPGFGGQKFITGMLNKIKAVRALVEARNPSVEIGVDGGIDHVTASLAAAAGADVLIAGTAVFRHPCGVVEAIDSMRAVASRSFTRHPADITKA